MRGVLLAGEGCPDGRGGVSRGPGGIQGEGCHGALRVFRVRVSRGPGDLHWEG